MGKCVNSGLTSHQQRGHTETGPRFKVSSERPEKRGIDHAFPGMIVQLVNYSIAAPAPRWEGLVCGYGRLKQNASKYQWNSD